MPGGASCSPCLMPATQTLPLKPRRSSRSTGPPKDSGPTPLLRVCCNSRAAPRGRIRTVRTGGGGTVAWRWWADLLDGPHEDARAEQPPAYVTVAARSHSCSPSKDVCGPERRGCFCIYFHNQKATSQRRVGVRGHLSQ